MVWLHNKLAKIGSRLLEYINIFVFYHSFHHSTILDSLSGWVATAADSGASFPDVDLGEKEWCDYDEKEVSLGHYGLCVLYPVAFLEFYHYFKILFIII